MNVWIDTDEILAHRCFEGRAGCNHGSKSRERNAGVEVKERGELRAGGRAVLRNGTPIATATRRVRLQDPRNAWRINGVLDRIAAANNERLVFS